MESGYWEAKAAQVGGQELDARDKVRASSSGQPAKRVLVLEAVLDLVFV